MHQLIIQLSLFNCSGLLKKSRGFMFPFLIHLSYFEVVTSFKTFKSTGALSLPKHRSMVFSFLWDLTHRSFSRILPDSSNFSGVILKFIAKFHARMNFSSVICISPRSFKFFASLVQPFQFLFRSVSTIVMVVLIIILNI